MEPSWSLDHKVPLSEGGNNKAHNLWALHRKCDEAKANILYSELLQQFINLEIKLPRFVKCLSNKGNKVCSPGKIYRTDLPPADGESLKFWTGVQRYYRHEFDPATLKAYKRQNKTPKGQKLKRAPKGKPGAKYYLCLANQKNELCTPGRAYTVKIAPTIKSDKSFWRQVPRLYQDEFRAISKIAYETMKPKGVSEEEYQWQPELEFWVPEYLRFIGNDESNSVFTHGQIYATRKSFRPLIWIKALNSRPQDFRPAKLWQYELANPESWRHRLK